MGFSKESRAERFQYVLKKLNRADGILDPIFSTLCFMESLCREVGEARCEIERAQTAITELCVEVLGTDNLFGLIQEEKKGGGS